MIKLYDYFRSTACYRVRIALNLKQLDYEKIPVHLIDHGGEHLSEAYHQINPQQLVPSLEHDGQMIHQSLAIIDYLDETYPEPRLLPDNPYDKALVRSLALIVACDMHPLNNLRVLNRIKSQFHATEEDVQSWYFHWLDAGFKAIEAKLKSIPRTQSVCFGSEVTLADVCLIPQVFNAHRFKFPMDDFPLINQINEYCLTLDAFKQAAP
jgi:maleylacetoacetate isomerase